jgi:hypothetical protein
VEGLFAVASAWGASLTASAMLVSIHVMWVKGSFMNRCSVLGRICGLAPPSRAAASDREPMRGPIVPTVVVLLYLATGQACASLQAPHTAPSTLPAKPMVPGAIAAQPSPPIAAEPDPCDVPSPPAPGAWLPNTPQPDDLKPPAHPASDCFFYKPAWQRFLFVTQPDSSLRPAFLSYASVEDIFGHKGAPLFAPQTAGVLSLAPRNIQAPNDTARLQDASQAGPLRGLLIDQNGRPIFYSIHVNQAFISFLQDNHLTTPVQLNNIPESLPFRPGIIELKSAWMIVDRRNPPSDFIITQARVPHLAIVGGKLTATERPPENVTVALLALHVVFALEGAYSGGSERSFRR